jgi:ABC-type transporter MlaC component
VNHGANQSFTVTPASGYHVADVLVDGVSVGAVPTYDFTNVVAGHTIDASFAINTYTITASAGANGSISPSGAVSVNHGANQSFTVTPASGYHVADVLVDGVSVGAVPTYDFTNVVAGHTIDASFALNTYTITASAGANGSISPSGAVSVNHGANQSFTITPATGYHVADVLVDGVSIGAVTSHDFTNVTAGHTIDASFEMDTYTITASAGTGGSITPAGAVSLPHGGAASYHITAAAHRHVADVLVDGVSVGPVSTWSFDGVAADHTIVVTFAIDTYAITAAAGPQGSITPVGTTQVPFGGSITVLVKPQAGYKVAKLIVDGRNVGSRTKFTIRGCSRSHVIQARFVKRR